MPFDYLRFYDVSIAQSLQNCNIAKVKFVENTIPAKNGDCIFSCYDVCTSDRIELRTIWEDNFRERLLLRASAENEDFVDPVVCSLAEAWLYSQDTRPFAIYSDDTINQGTVPMSLSQE